MNYWLLLIPVFSAFTGWLVLHLAIKFLFHPVKAKKIAGLKLQGILPAKQQHLALQIGKAVAKAFPLDKLEQKISNPANLKKILPMIEEHIDDFLRNKLGKELPMIGMFIGDKTIGKVKEAFMKEIESLFPQIMQEYARNMKQDLDISQQVVQTIQIIPTSMIEKLLLKNMGRQLRLGRFAAAGIGFIVGLIPMIILLLV